MKAKLISGQVVGYCRDRGSDLGKLVRSRGKIEWEMQPSGQTGGDTEVGNLKLVQSFRVKSQHKFSWRSWSLFW